MNTKFLNFLFLISVQLVCAQISGTIIELDESLPLEYATAALFREQDKSLQTGVITNQDGFFEIKNIPNGRYYLEMSFIGYSTKTVENLELSKSQKSINVAGNSMFNLSLILCQDSRNILHYKIIGLTIIYYL